MKRLKCKLCKKRIGVFTKGNREMAEIMRDIRGEEEEISDQDLLETAFSELRDHYKISHPDFYEKLKRTGKM